MAQVSESSQLVTLRDTHFSLKDGLGITLTTLDQISDSEEASQESEYFISPKSVSRLFIEQGEYSAVPICCQHYFKATVGWSEWVSFKLESKSRKIIVEAGLTIPLLVSCLRDMFKDEVCLRHVVRRWSPQTHTIVCSWGEFTPTSEDVYNIMRLLIIGDTDPFDITLHKDLEKKLKTLQEGTGCSRGRFEFSGWVRHFWGSTKGDVFENGVGFHSDCNLEAMLAHWLSKYIFADFSCGNVQQWVVPSAVVLAIGACLPLAPLLLGHVYRMLDLILNDEKEGAGCYGITSSVCSIFLQVFIWKGFKDLAVEPVTPTFVRKLEGGRKSRNIVEFPLCCRWFRRKAKKDAFEPAILDDISRFILRPYSSILGFEVFPFYYLEDQSWIRPSRKAMFLATTLHHMPTFGDRFESVVARYSPHRVRGKFGINQGVPASRWFCLSNG